MYLSSCCVLITMLGTLVRVTFLRSHSSEFSLIGSERCLNKLINVKSSITEPKLIVQIISYFKGFLGRRNLHILKDEN